MRAYGIPRVINLECPDKADVKLFGLATSDRCSRADRGKRESRRIWRKKAREAARKLKPEDDYLAKRTK